MNISEVAGFIVLLGKWEGRKKGLPASGEFQVKLTWQL